jgi:hypothetical protein
MLAALVPAQDGGARIATGTFLTSKDNAPIWKALEGAEFKCNKHERDKQGKEDLIDKALHADILGLVLSLEAEPGVNTLVLATGDGGPNDGRTDFVTSAFHAACRGWRVEVWGWKGKSSSNWRTLRELFPGQIELRFLDDVGVRVSRQVGSGGGGGGALSLGGGGGGGGGVPAEWACRACTFLNPVGNSVCGICSTSHL